MKQRRSTFSSQPEPLSSLCSRWYPDQSVTVNGRHFNFRSERRLRHCDWNAAVNVVTNSRKERMRCRIDYHVQIPACPSTTPRISLACHANSRPCGDSCRQRYFQSLAAANTPFTMPRQRVQKVIFRIFLRLGNR